MRSYDWDVNDQYLMEDCGTSEENGTPPEGIMDYPEYTGLFELSWKEHMTAEDYAGHWSAGRWVIACGPDGVQAKRRGLRQGQGISAGLRIISLRCRVLVRWRVYLYTILL